jgi:phosphatidylglycerophosphate synthase
MARRLLARKLHQESAAGARLDTVADAVFYSSLLLAVAALNPQMVFDELPWILVAIGSFLLSWLASWLKFRRLPSYHTWAAKGVWVVVGAGIVCLLAGWAAWPFRLAMVCVGITNLEATAISLTLNQCQTDVRSILHVQKRNQQPDDADDAV